MRNNKISVFTYAVLVIAYLLFNTSGEVYAQKITSKTLSNNFDVVVYGATPSGIFAAINAAKYGHTVALVEEYDHVGGLMTGGLSYTDFKSYEALGGSIKEYQDRAVRYYAKKYGEQSKQVKDCNKGIHVEPHVTLILFNEMIKEQQKIKLLTSNRLIKASARKNADGSKNIQSSTFLDLKSNKEHVLIGRVYIDATYEGDLAALAGAAYRVGRESRDEYCERFAGKIFTENGLILNGGSGEGDKKVQGYNFRLIMTDSARNSRPVIKPATYKRENYTPILKVFEEGKVKDVFTESRAGILRLQRIANQKVDVNDIKNAPVRVSLLGKNYKYPEGSPGVRAQIVQEHKDHILGLVYFLQNDESISKSIRDEAKKWGLAKDEFSDNENFPYRLYIREARRILGEYVFTEHDTYLAANSIRSKLNEDAIAIGDYSLNCHGESPPGEIYPTLTEGDFGHSPSPFQIPYGVITPLKFENLLVSVAISSTHVGFSCLRLEPTWSAMGQAAGLAAHLSIKDKVQVNKINLQDLQALLRKNKAKTIYVSDVDPSSPYFEAVQYFGTRGLFHHLYSLDQIKLRPLKGFGLQYKEAALYHGIEPAEPLEKPLAIKWINMMQEDKRAELSKLYNSKDWSRGEFLQAAFEMTVTNGKGR